MVWYHPGHTLDIPWYHSPPQNLIFKQASLSKSKFENGLLPGTGLLRPGLPRNRAVSRASPGRSAESPGRVCQGAATCRGRFRLANPASSSVSSSSAPYLKSSSRLSVGSNRADHLRTGELHLGPHPATVHFARANQRDLFLHQLNQSDTAIGLAFGGKSSLRCEEAFAGQPPIVISRQFHNGIVPLAQPHFKPFLQSLGDGAKPPENRQNPPVVALYQLWQDGFIQVWLGT